MLKNLLLVVIAVTLVGSLAFAIYDGAKDDDEVVEMSPAVSVTTPTATEPTPPIATSVPTTEIAAVEATPIPEQPVQQFQAIDNVGEAWVATGTIVSVDDFGFELLDTNASTVYIELGPPTFWKDQGALFAGETVVVDGFANADQYHARLVIKLDGTQIETRTLTGQPLWAGGVNNSQEHTTNQEPNLQVEEWVTLEGVVSAIGNNSLTVETTGAQVVTVQMGRPGFAESQGINFAVGDHVSMVGFWQSGQFQVGDITNTQTGDRLMLRDPNGRPLWAGPGGQGGAGQGGAGQGGNGFQGGRNQ